jgi:hypothetical protein
VCHEHHLSQLDHAHRRQSAQIRRLRQGQDAVRRFLDPRLKLRPPNYANLETKLRNVPRKSIASAMSAFEGKTDIAIVERNVR